MCGCSQNTQAPEGSDLTPDEEKLVGVDSSAFDEGFQDFIDQMLMPREMYDGIQLLKSEGFSRQEQDAAVQAIIASGRGDNDYNVDELRQEMLARRAAAQQEVPNAG
jgi:hypothetical protein